MSISITTKDFVKSQPIEITDLEGVAHEWEFVSPGAGLSLELSKIARELSQNTEATAEDQSKMLDSMFEYYGSIFRDKTEDNSEVKRWLRETPIETIGLAVSEINKQING